MPTPPNETPIKIPEDANKSGQTQADAKSKLPEMTWMQALAKAVMAPFVYLLKSMGMSTKDNAITHDTDPSKYRSQSVRVTPATTPAAKSAIEEQVKGEPTPPAPASYLEKFQNLVGLKKTVDKVKDKKPEAEVNKLKASEVHKSAAKTAKGQHQETGETKVVDGPVKE